MNSRERSGDRRAVESRPLALGGRGALRDPRCDGAADGADAGRPLLREDGRAGLGHSPWRVEFPTAGPAAGARFAAPVEPLLRGAAVELERLHAEELARLLLQAIGLRAHLAAFAPVGDATRGSVEPHPAAPRSGPRAPARFDEGLELDAWRGALDDELTAARADGARLSPALAALLEACTAPLGQRAARDWPTDRSLALAALALAPGARTRLALGRVALREGDLDGALACFQRALASARSPRLRAELRAELRAALEAASSSLTERACRSLSSSSPATVGVVAGRTCG